MKKLLSITLAALLAAGAVTAVGAKKAPKPELLGKYKAESPAPEWMENAVIYEANLRQGTPSRDLKGLQQQLPRLRDLGVDIVWLMPIHPISEKERKGKLGSYYAVRDYKAVNPEFGDLQDLKEFVRTAHNLGMKVILDEVANHTGADHQWVTEHPEYYARNKEGKMYGPYDWTDVYKLDYSNPATREAMADALEYWVREADIDGYRCDVAGEVPTSFWNEVRPRLQAIKPVFMLAEASKPELLLKAFDADYAWPMKDVFNAIAATKGVNEWAVKKNENRPKMDARDIPALIERQKKEFPRGSVHMQMVTNHDLNSWEGTEFDRYGAGTGAFAVLSYTLPGMPMLYTGQEVGFNHPFEFFDRDTVMPTPINNEFTTFYETLNALKHRNKALRAHASADNTVFTPALSNDVITMTRTAPEGGKVVVIANLSNDPVTLDYGKNKAPDVTGLSNIFTGESAVIPAELKPWQYLLFAD